MLTSPLKKPLSPAQKRAKKKARAERRKQFQWIFINGKQVRIKRQPTIDGMSVDEFIRENADPIWLHQNEMWELIEPEDIALFHDDEPESLDANDTSDDLDRL